MWETSGRLELVSKVCLCRLFQWHLVLGDKVVILLLQRGNLWYFLEDRGIAAHPVSAFSQLPSVQNNLYAPVAYLEVA